MAKQSPEDYLLPPVQYSEELHKKNFLILEGKTHGSYSYSDSYVAKTLSHCGKSWYQSHEALHQEGNSMLTLRQFVDFLALLKSGKAFDGKGNKVSSSELEKILKKITQQRDPWRAEWLDADFKVVKDKFHLNYEPRYVQGKLQPQRSEPLQSCLMKDKTPGINLDDYLKRATSQGLPPSNAKSGSLYYWSPANGWVVGFRAYAGWVSLDCRRDPQDSDATLGVRRRRAKN